ncbi:hypothetical protein bcere0016_57200 [Bacillus cereus 95/8201]|uniref:Uncharacterized protein n=3 Tax=Bacillus cereus group TaxID=86661 RepID=A0A1C4DQ07_BACCE|nr:MULTISPECIES: hypothetical protein [Bacillus]OUB93682.1 hypothetical protein BK752_25805 [Bacillus thuringiensis serovar canadensis]AJH60235.1 hypothetical protein BG11_5508 [Bacillus cereus]AJK37582.1 hypothetical protein BF33_5669 [Bacillus cereus]EEL13764.1 hypothetical protein bcere0016_57200 [Bacillus cereus 95/8201]KFL83679.1 hypothetical protein DJ51_5384 [Bacillus cereus]
MYTDSIEYLTEKIYHHNTKEYFKEVMSSYTNGNNRSAIVMLYSVVVCDLVYKLQELEDKYSDDTAKEILEKIREQQRQHPNSPNWESDLIDEIYAKTNLLEVHDKENLDHLKKHRNLSAHPVLDQLDILFRPNKENVRSHMRNMLDGVLCKSPLLSNKLIVPFVLDLESIKNDLVKDEDLSRYLESKYFSKINEALSKNLFKELWKFVFRLEDDKCEENRFINFRALRLLLNRNPNQFLAVVREQSSYYSQITFDNLNILYHLQILFSENPDLYVSTTDDLKVVLTEKANNDIAILVMSAYLSSNIEEHFSKISSRISDEDYCELPISISNIDFLYNFSINMNYIPEFIDFVIQLFKGSYDYDSADSRFTNYIEPYVEEFTREHFLQVLEIINNNSQIYRRRQARVDNNYLKTVIEERYEGTIDFSTYENFTL